MYEVKVTNLLMRQDIAADFAFFSLNNLDIGLHTFRRVRTSEEVADVCIRVQATELIWEI